MRLLLLPNYTKAYLRHLFKANEMLGQGCLVFTMSII